ncbi:MAG TPA: glycosyltransferase family 2 protein [Candidatus Saccharimonadales bacterium]|nr:glycosyltransferase family 2 protein [Candidatus Saccharimonadales bacterium]
MADVELSIIILSYNTRDITLGAIESIEKNYPKEVASGQYEVIVTDNDSPDKSIEAFREYKKHTKIKSFHPVDNGGNIGFAAGNNKGVPYAKGKYVLFLNPDTVVYPKTLTYMLEFMESHPKVGAASCKLINKDGKMDFNCHRGFPTPWNAFCFFSGLQRIFPKSKLFAGYTQGWKDLSTNHEVDALEGAFMLMPREVGEKVGWWDEDYFFYGEDLQFCYDIRKLGYEIWYIGEVSIMHIGGASSGIKPTSLNITKANIEGKKKVQGWRFDAMKIFFKKNYSKKYPALLQWIVASGITYMKKRTFKRLDESVQK